MPRLHPVAKYSGTSHPVTLARWAKQRTAQRLSLRCVGLQSTLGLILWNCSRQTQGMTVNGVSFI